MRKVLSLIPVLLVLSATLFGQAGTEGSILGTVQDATGAVIPGAQVTAANLNTGLKRTAVTNETGSFEIFALPIGQYSVAVTAKGFKTWNLARVEITVGARNRIAPVLEVGEVSEQISVEATAELLQTEQSSVQTVVQMHQIRELPLSVRNPVVLVNLVPGMRYIGQGGPERGSTVQGFGTRDNQTQFALDGLNANAAMDEGGMAIPNVDTIAEFNVQTNSFSAENGRNPIQVQVAPKSAPMSFTARCGSSCKTTI